MNQLQQLADTLDAQDKVKKDFLSPTQNLHFVDGKLILTHAGQDVVFNPSTVFHSQVSEKLGIPKGYYDKMKDKAIKLLDSNVNHWLADESKNLLVRTFMNGNDENTARAFLSDRYNMIDNMEILLTLLDTLKEVGVPVEINRAELSETRMYVHVECPEIEVMAEQLLKKYAKAISVGSGVIAGFKTQNSEVGYGAHEITPALKILACKNLAMMKKDSLRRVHLGGKLDELEFYKNTAITQKNRELVKEQMKHAVKKFLSKKYLQEQIEFLTIKGDKKIEAQVQPVVEVIGKENGFTEETKAKLLDHFLRGGDDRRVGMFNAVTEMAQTFTDVDLKNDVEGMAVGMLTDFDRIEAAAIKLQRSSN